MLSVRKQKKVKVQPVPILFIMGVMKAVHAAPKRQRVRLFAAEDEELESGLISTKYVLTLLDTPVKQNPNIACITKGTAILTFLSTHQPYMSAVNEQMLI